MLFNNSTVLLFLTNLLEMSIIVFLLLPFVDIVSLSKNIQEYKAHMTKNDLTITLGILYAMIILGFGIIGPMRTLNRLRLTVEERAAETPTEKLLRIIESTYAIRDYLLAGFSLFFIVVIWRLFDFIIFSAKLHEFSELMSNYDLVDINYSDEKAETQSKSSSILDEKLELEEEEVEVDYVRWPSVIQLDKSDTRLIKTFFKENPRRPSDLEKSGEEEKSVEEPASTNVVGEDLKKIKSGLSRLKNTISVQDATAVVSELITPEDTKLLSLKKENQEKEEPKENEQELLNNEQVLEASNIKEKLKTKEETIKVVNLAESKPIILPLEQSEDNHKNKRNHNKTEKKEEASKSTKYKDKVRKNSKSEQLKDNKLKEEPGIVIRDSDTSEEITKSTKIVPMDNKEPKPKNG